MKKLFLIICSLLILIAACKKKNSLPKGIFPRDKMQAVLWDMVRTGEFLNSFVIYRDTTGNRAGIIEKWNKKVYSIHKINEQDFIKSYEYYRAHPPLMREIMDSLTRQKAAAAAANHPVSEPTPNANSTIAPPAFFPEKARPIKDSLFKKNRRNRVAPALP